MMFHTSVRPCRGMLGSLAMSSRVPMALDLRTSRGWLWSVSRALMVSAPRRMLRGTEVSSTSMARPVVMVWMREAIGVTCQGVPATRGRIAPGCRVRRHGRVFRLFRRGTARLPRARRRRRVEDAADLRGLGGADALDGGELHGGGGEDGGDGAEGGEEAARQDVGDAGQPAQEEQLPLGVGERLSGGGGGRWGSGRRAPL